VYCAAYPLHVVSSLTQYIDTSFGAFHGSQVVFGKFPLK